MNKLVDRYASIRPGIIFFVCTLLLVGGAMPPCGCLAANTETAPGATDWKQQIQADWLRQLTSPTPSLEAYAVGGCDGIKNGKITFHTKRQENPWWQVDLGKDQPLSRVVVYNATDCPERAKNLMVLVSADGKDWREAYRHNGQVFFGAKDGKPLVVQLKGERARFVRIALPGTEYLHLDEVEVYGTSDPQPNLALGKPATLSSNDPQHSKAPTAPKQRRAQLADIQKSLNGMERLYENLRGTGKIPDLRADKAALDTLKAQVNAAKDLDAENTEALYFKVRWAARELALKNPLVTSRPLLFMQRRRAVGYMLYEYLGWYYAHGNNPDNGAYNPKVPTPELGGGIYVLDQPGKTLKPRELLASPTLHGHLVTLSLSFDAKTIYFAFANPKDKEPYTQPGYAMAPCEPGAKYNTFHIWAMDADGSRLRQITDGPFDDFDPCPLPDGGLAFMSTRRGSKLRCGGGSAELTYTLHRMDVNGQNIRTLSFHETHEWHPSVLNDGRLVYTRWDYVDRNAAKFHGLWTCNADGTHPANFFGNYTTRPWACYQAKAVPGSDKVLFVAGGHHANVGGTLVMLDPSRAGLNTANGEDRFDALEWLTPEICFPEAQGWPKKYFYSPWPLSEDHYLVAFSPEPLCGGYTGSHRETETGLYYFDRFGNLELLFRQPGISAVYPIPLTPRPTPPKSNGTIQEELGEQGEFLLSDVYHSVLPMPPGRRIAQLRVFQVLPKSRTDNADNPRMGHPDQANARMLLGSVPVEQDGSAFFRAPARKPLYFQAVDESGRAVQSMRTIVYLQPGERRSCVGCHEPPGATPTRREALASRRAPSALRPGPDGSLPFCYPRLVQPVLDRQCVRCHDGSTGQDKSPLVLTGSPQGRFTKSYESLKPFVRWPSYDAPATRPGQAGADLSPLSALLVDEKHRRYVTVPDDDLRTIYLWLDAQVPFFGTYEENDLLAQKLGQAVLPPSLQ